MSYRRVLLTSFHQERRTLVDSTGGRGAVMLATCLIPRYFASWSVPAPAQQAMPVWAMACAA